MRSPLFRFVLPASMAVLPAIGACGSAVAPSSDVANQTLSNAVFVETTKTALPAQPCGPGRTTGCYSNYTVVADLDGDGNLDIVYANGGNHFVPGPADPMAIYFGDGKGAFVDKTTAFRGIAKSHVRQVAIGDIDGDGRLDIFFPGGYGLDDDQLFIQQADKTFVNEAKLRLPDGGMRSTAGGTHLGDIDGDGDLDLLIADWGPSPNPDNPSVAVSPVTLRVFVNDGTGKYTRGAALDAPDGSTSTDVDILDVDGDFDLDVVLTQRNGHSRIYHNDSKGNFSDITNVAQFPAKRSNEAISFNGEACDIDGDGDLDLFFDGGGLGPDHDTQVFINDGTGKYKDESEARISKEVASDDNQVKCADVDNDGDFDLVVASLSNGSEKLFINKDGKGHFDDASNLMPPVHDPTLGIDFGDFDGDGRIDYTTAQGEDGRFDWINRVFKSATKLADVRPPVFRKIEKPVVVMGQPIVVRVGVSDAHTSETGQAVREVSLKVKDQNGESTVKGRFVGGDIYRFEIPAPRGSLVITPIATDRAKNTATGTPQNITIP